MHAFGNQNLPDDEKEEVLKREVEEAVKNREIQMYLQFVVDKDTKKICGAEALSRWKNSRGELLNPESYIGLMHEAGMIEQLDFYMLEESCKQLEEWQRLGYGDLNLSCNITRTSISQENFLWNLRIIVNKYKFNYERLWIEITEDSLADSDITMCKNISECRKMGFFIVLDDLGSGYSSLRDLCDYPLDCVKIDRIIIEKSSMTRGMKLLNGICRLTHEMDIKVVCEGVETEEENKRIETSACEYIQGYYYSGVFPKENAMEYYKRYTSGLK